MASNENELYIVGPSLTAVPITSLLASRAHLWNKVPLPERPQAPPIEGSPPIAVLPNGTLLPGRLYESSTDAQVRYYLPEYRLHVRDGRYTTSLKWRGPQDDPSGPLAFLTVGLLAAAPDGAGFTLQEIDHQAVASLVYQVPVRNAGPAPGAAVDAFVGDWTNVDPSTRGMTRLVIARTSDTTATFHAWGRCHPSDCDWGTTSAAFASGALVGTHEFVWQKIRITAKREGDTLVAEVFTDYAAAAKPDRTELYVLSGGGQSAAPIVDVSPAPALELSPPLRVELGALERVSADLRQCRFAIQDKADFDRIYQVLTDPALRGRLEVRCLATVGRRTWRQVRAGTRLPLEKERLDVKRHVSDVLLSDTIVRDHRKLVVDPRLPRAIVRHNLPEALGSTGPAVPRMARTALVPEAMSITRLRMSETIANSDFVVKASQGLKHVIPLGAVTDGLGAPALLLIPVEALQTIDPFIFPIATNAYVFDLPGDVTPTATSIFLRSEVSSADGRVLGVYYQDSAYASRFYYQPQEFRLARVSEAPYLPDLRIAFVDVISADGADGADATIDYQVKIAYRAQPYLDPGVLDQMKQHVAAAAPAAEFRALTPESSKLSLRVPQDEAAGGLIALDRTDAEIRFDQGIVDSFDVTPTEFQQIFAFFRASGLDGTVEVTLPGNTTAFVPLKLSLQESSGTVFARTAKGPVGGGLFRITLTNLIESPVLIDKLHGTTAAPGVLAWPQTNTPLRVLPGASVDIDYRLSADVSVADLVPVLTSSIEADLGVLLPQVMVNQGYTSATFPLAVTVEPDFFTATPPGRAPLAAIKIDFDSGASALLTAAAPRAELKLRMPLLPWLMNAPNARHYSYRVTNLHGAGDTLEMGDQTDELQGDGEGTLSVTPAGA